MFMNVSISVTVRPEKANCPTNVHVLCTVGGGDGGKIVIAS